MNARDEFGEFGDALTAIGGSPGDDEDGGIYLPRFDAERNLIWGGHLIQEQIELAGAAGALDLLDQRSHDGLLK